MMPAVSVVGLFCEDIRPEKSGSETIVGVFPSNLTFHGLPNVVPKFCLYARINLDPQSDDSPIQLRIHVPGMDEPLVNTIDPELIAKAKADARDQNAPLATIVSRLLVAGFQVNQIGRINAIARVGNDEFVCASLYVAIAPGPTT
jgi:hypothetical protein